MREREKERERKREREREREREKEREGVRKRVREGEYVTVDAKTIRKSVKFFVEIESDFASPTVYLISLCCKFCMDSPFRC